MGEKYIYPVGFLCYNFTAKIDFSYQIVFFFLSNAVFKEPNIKTKSAAIAFFLLLFSISSLFPFFFFSFSSVIFRLIVGQKNLPPVFSCFLGQTAAIFVWYVFKNLAG